MYNVSTILDCTFFIKIVSIRAMFKENLYQSFEILLREHRTFPLKEHQHSFFEAVYIVSGSGLFQISRPMSELSKFSYSEGSLFLIPPNTTHCFEVSSKSKFIFVRFTDNYIDGHLGSKAKHSLYLSYTTPLITLKESDLNTVALLFKIMESELADSGNFSELILQDAADIILALMARVLLRSSDSHFNCAGEIAKEMHMLQYIQTNLHQPDKLRVESLVRQFGLSKNYIGRYFKNHFQESLQQYISRNRMKRVEYLVANSLMSVKEIAYDMGFSDSCHLVKAFKKFSGMSPLQYRRKCTLQKKQRKSAKKYNLRK